MKKRQTKVVERVIEICSYCNGHGVKGVFLSSPNVEISNEDFELLSLEDKKKLTVLNCANCKGKGRMEKTTTIEWTTLK